MRIPSVINAGDSIGWTDYSLTDSKGAPVDSGSYTLTYAFRGTVAAGNFDLAGTPSGTGWTFAMSIAQSTALNTGATALTWYWQAVATKSQVRVTAGTGTLLAQPNVAGMATEGTFDGRSQAEKDLAAIRAEMSARITGGATLEYTVGSRSLKKEPMAALVAMEQRCLRIVARERRASAGANGLGYSGRLGVRFTR